jgi:hypothetical protein
MKTILLGLSCITIFGGCMTHKPPRPEPSRISLYEYEGRDGRTEALSDIKAGTPKLKTYGLPSPVCEKYAEILKERIGVKFQPIAGCCVDEHLVKYAQSYNETTTAHLELKHGKGILDKLWADAELEYNKSEGKK